MTNRSTVSPDKHAALLAARGRNESIRSAARSVGVSYGAARRALGAQKGERIKDRLRTKDEFKETTAIRAPRRNNAVFSWSLEMIRKARDAQMLGQFQAPVMLARALRTDAAMYTAYHNRIAPQSAVEAKLVAANGARGDRAKCRALASCIVPRDVLAGINGTLANHGVAIGYVEQEVNDEGTRIDFKLTEWPLEFVRWNPTLECLVTKVRDGFEQPIVHGDGRWIVFRKFQVDPWTQEACVIPSAVAWYAHMNGIRDWAAATGSHGRPKLTGELPSGMALVGPDGKPNPDAQRYLDMLADLADGEAPAGVQPSGAKTTLLFNGSTAWQIFKELVETLDKAASRIYQGTDAALGAQGGAPGVDISMLFGVATTKIQGDFAAIEEGLNTGFYQPWAAVNYGDSTYAPSFEYQLPDPDAEEKVEQYDKRLAAFFSRLKDHRDAGMLITQDMVNELAEEYKVSAPTLAPAAAQAVKLDIAPTDVAKCFTIDEIRASQGGIPLGTPRGHMTIPQADEADKAIAQAHVAVVKSDATANATATTQPAAAA
jgi:hypothetical protein